MTLHDYLSIMLLVVLYAAVGLGAVACFAVMTETYDWPEWCVFVLWLAWPGLLVLFVGALLLCLLEATYRLPSRVMKGVRT